MATVKPYADHSPLTGMIAFFMIRGGSARRVKSHDVTSVIMASSVTTTGCTTTVSRSSLQRAIVKDASCKLSVSQCARRKLRRAYIFPLFRTVRYRG